MKCTSDSNHKFSGHKMMRKAAAVCLCIVIAGSISACGRSFDNSYEDMSVSSSYQPVNVSAVFSLKENSFASSLCLPQDVQLSDESAVDTSASDAAGLFDVDHSTTLYGSGLTTKVYPASLTKLMTALVAFKYGDLEKEITFSENAVNPGADAQRLGIEAGCKMTIEQALNYLLVFSANDCATAIAENVGDNYDDFIQKMNDEALAIGATASHFTNPHGLHDENHYTTAYDLYLIFNACMKYDKFQEMIAQDSYSTFFEDEDGNSRSITVNSTDAYLEGKVTAPDGITVIGGKTGTTDPAGHCLIIMSQNSAGATYISVVMKADSTDDLYSEMNSLLAQIPN